MNTQISQTYIDYSAYQRIFKLLILLNVFRCCGIQENGVKEALKFFNSQK